PTRTLNAVCRPQLSIASRNHRPPSQVDSAILRLDRAMSRANTVPAFSTGQTIAARSYCTRLASMYVKPTATVTITAYGSSTMNQYSRVQTTVKIMERWSNQDMGTRRQYKP